MNSLWKYWTNLTLCLVRDPKGKLSFENLLFSYIKIPVRFPDHYDYIIAFPYDFEFLEHTWYITQFYQRKPKNDTNFKSINIILRYIPGGHLWHCGFAWFAICWLNWSVGRQSLISYPTLLNILDKSIATNL